MSVSQEVLMILGMFAVTFSVRYVLFATAGRFHFPVWAQDALSFVPPAVLTAIVIPAVLAPKGQVWFDLSNPYLLAGVVALLIGLWRQNLLLTICLSMAVFLLLKFI